MRLTKRNPLATIGTAMLLLALDAQARQPTDLEQYFLEIVNRARADPEAEVVRLSSKAWGDDDSPASPDLNEGLPPGTIPPTPKPPLAFDVRLIDSASDYADFLLAEEKFGHGEDGTPLTRMQAAGYPFSSPAASGENIGISSYNVLLPLSEALLEEHHVGYFVDRNVAGRGHRISLLNAAFREVGIAVRLDSDGESYFGPGYHDIVSVQNFARSSGRVFVTGAIYRDADANGFYGPGESAGAMPLEVRTSGGVRVAAGTSFASGGYSINLAGVPAGSYYLVAFGGAGGLVERRSFWWDGAQNVKVDLVDPAFLSSPVFGNPYRPDLRIGRSATSLTGNDVYSNSAKRQRVELAARSARALVWHAVLENDGYHDDLVGVSAARGNRRFAIRYLHRRGGGYANVTASMAAGTEVSVHSGAATAYRIRVKPRKPSLGRRVGASFHLRAVSGGDVSRTDRVNGALVNRTRKPKRQLR